MSGIFLIDFFQYIIIIEYLVRGCQSTIHHRLNLANGIQSHHKEEEAAAVRLRVNRAHRNHNCHPSIHSSTAVTLIPSTLPPVWPWCASSTLKMFWPTSPNTHAHYACIRGRWSPFKSTASYGHDRVPPIS